MMKLTFTSYHSKFQPFKKEYSMLKSLTKILKEWNMLWMYISAICSTLSQKACPSEASQYLLGVDYLTLPQKRHLPSLCYQKKDIICAVDYLTLLWRHKASQYIPALISSLCLEYIKQVNIYALLITTYIKRN